MWTFYTKKVRVSHKRISLRLPQKAINYEALTDQIKFID